ncbi:M23 family metallopeptidase [Sedimentibacter sp. B4]|uniref:M23 family metallopeptidase n=1 Tax=Sedimentibacter sp. B4 TaxID=304766 RepID=UPI0002F4394F|nr:M23 family metallopeptidase [Sedimentibacter sp. B4]
MNKITRKRINIKRKESINKKLALQVIFSIVLVAAVIVTKNIDSEVSRKFIDAADQKITQSLNLKEVKSTIGEAALGIKNRLPFINGKDSDFAAPVNGKIYKDYGINKGTEANYYNHGLDIISNTQSVKSISSGTVVQLGNNEKLSDYVVVESKGKTIIYGQIKEAFVAEGEHVAAGDVIAALNEESMMLHLEVWEDGESVNPAKLFDIID